MEAVSRTLESLDWITLVIFSSLLFLVISKRFFYTRFMNFMILPFNSKYIFMYNKKDRLMNGFQLFFTLFQVCNLSLFLYLTASALLIKDGVDSPLNYLVLLGALLAFLLAKILLQLFNGFVFSNDKVITEMIFKKLSYLNYSALALFLANLVLTYIAPGSQLVIYLGIFLFILVNIMGWITLIKNHQKLITTYFFYFILYLCALEIAPLVLIVNALTY